jgi:protein TonB
MQPEKILQSDVLDILFENRNKDYGAYTLRREYDTRLGKAVLIAFSLAALLLLLSYSFKKKTNTLINPLFTDIHIMPPPPKPLTKQILPLKKQQYASYKKTAQTPVATMAYKKSIIVVDKDATLNIPKVTDILKSNISTVTTTGPSATGLQNAPKGISNSDGKTGVDQPSTDNGPIDHPDVYPDFPGGKMALMKFLQKNLTNPKDLEDEEMISVKVRFVVNADGSISGFEVIQSGGDDFDGEVLRVLKKMPHWIPGKSNGNNVSVYYEVPVKFVAGAN